MSTDIRADKAFSIEDPVHLNGGSAGHLFRLLGLVRTDEGAIDAADFRNRVTLALKHNPQFAGADEQYAARLLTRLTRVCDQAEALGCEVVWF